MIMSILRLLSVWPRSRVVNILMSERST